MKTDTDNYDMYVGLARISSGLAIYLVGVGRYRFVIAIVVYILFSILSKPKFRLILDYLFFPSVVITLVLDVNMGPLYPVFPFNSILLAFLLLVTFDKAVKTKVEAFISKMSNKDLFNVCPNCGYENTDISSKCSNCNYTSGMAISDCNSSLTHNDKIYRMLDIGKEPILYKLRLFPLISVTVNERKETRMYLVITKKHLLLVDYMYFSSSWTKKDVISIDSILSVAKTDKKLYVASEPTLEICTRTDKYELTFLKILNNQSKMDTIIDVIRLLQS